MFNLLPGQGLGWTGNREIAFGLGTIWYVSIIVTPVPEEDISSGGGGPGEIKLKYDGDRLKIASKIIRDDEEILEIIIIAIDSGLIK